MHSLNVLKLVTFPAIEERKNPVLTFLPNNVSHNENFDGLADTCTQEFAFLQSRCDRRPNFSLLGHKSSHWENLTSTRCEQPEEVVLAAAKLLQQQQALAAALKGINVTLTPAIEDKTEMDWIRRIFVRLRTNSTAESGDPASPWEDPNLLCWAVLLAGLACLLRIAVIEYHSYKQRVREAASGTSGRRPMRGSPFTLKEYVQYRCGRGRRVN